MLIDLSIDQIKNIVEMLENASFKGSCAEEVSILLNKFRAAKREESEKLKGC